MEIGADAQTAQFWEYDGDVGRRWNLDPKPNSGISEYSVFTNNPFWFKDPFGDTLIVNNRGDILSNDKKDNVVMVHHFIDNSNHSIGELGKVIDVNEIYKNLLASHAKEAKSLWNPLTFKNYVTDRGKWDLKLDKNSIFGLGNDGKTKFLFQGRLMEAQDIGNHHFGVVAKAMGIFPEKFILMQAGKNQMSKPGDSRPEWQKYKVWTETIYIEHGMKSTVTFREMQYPYGDDPQDQGWIQLGFDYYKKNKSELLK